MVKQVTTKFKLDYEAIGKMAFDVVDETVVAVANRAGLDFDGDIIWTDRPHGAVWATTFKARRLNAKENTLMKAAFSQ
jgi:hypothetical protein